MGESARVNADRHRTWVNGRIEDLTKASTAQADLLTAQSKDQRAMQTNLDALKADTEWLRSEVIELTAWRDKAQSRLDQDYVRRKTLEASVWARLKLLLTGRVDVSNNAAVYR